MIGAETMREECRDGVAFGAVGTGADDFDVDARQLGRFEDRLAAATARRDGLNAGQRDHREARDLVEPEGDLRGGQRGLLGAQAKREAGVFDIGPDRDLARDTLHRAADREVRIRRVSAKRGAAGGLNKLLVGHAIDLKRGDEKKTN